VREQGFGPEQRSATEQGSAAHEPRPRRATIRLASVRMRARLMSGVRSSRGVYPHEHGLFCLEMRPPELSKSSRYEQWFQAGSLMSPRKMR
jgi:hypothetical protein